MIMSLKIVRSRHTHQLATAFHVPRLPGPEKSHLNCQKQWPAFRSARKTNELAISLQLTFWDYHDL